MSPEEAPQAPESFERLLLQASGRFRLPFSNSSLPRLARYLSELDRWRRTINLTGELSSRELAEHVLESLAGSDLITDGAKLIDIGSGAGFPGLPLSIARPDLAATLLEPRSKRAAFLRHVLRVIPVENAAVLEERVENLRDSAWTVATTRAVGGLGRLVRDAPFLEPGALLLAWTTGSEALAGSLNRAFMPLEPRPLPVRGAIAAFRKR